MFCYIKSSLYTITDHIHYIRVITWSIVNNNKTRINILSPFHPNTQKRVISISVLEIYIFFLLLGLNIENSVEKRNRRCTFRVWHQTVNSFLLILIFLGKSCQRLNERVSHTRINTFLERYGIENYKKVIDWKRYIMSDKFYPNIDGWNTDVFIIYPLKARITYKVW